jgi:hypothetical protein
MLVSVLQRVNGWMPWAKKLVPFFLYKKFMRKYFSQAEKFDRKEHRRWMRDVMMPSLCRHAHRAVVFVGCAPYTWHYERIFEGSNLDYITIDPMPASRVWGSTHHIVDRVQRIDRYVDAGTIDAVVMVGVFGFGVNTPQDLKETLTSIHSVLEERGVLVLGWNTDATPDPAEHPILDELFESSGYHELPPRKRCSETLIVDVYRARPRVGIAEARTGPYGTSPTNLLFRGRP